MNRRDFITRMLGAGAALAILPSIELTAKSLAADPDRAAWLSTYDAIHREAARLFAQNLNKADWAYTHDPGALKLGNVLPDGTMIRHQLNVEAQTYEQSVPGPSIEPAMHVLAQSTLRYGIDRFAGLPSDLPGCEYAKSIGPLRLIIQYDINRDITLARFDVVGGCSPAALAYLERRRIDELKTRIRRRLRTAQTSGYSAVELW